MQKCDGSGLDENFGPKKAGFLAKGRITEIMATVRGMVGTMIQSHTPGASTGNPLSLMPEPGVINEQAFEPIDWAVYQVRVYGLRLMVPLTENYVRLASFGLHFTVVRAAEW